MLPNSCLSYFYVQKSGLLAQQMQKYLLPLLRSGPNNFIWGIFYIQPKHQLYIATT